MSKTVKLILLPIIILWVITVITGYYWGHQYILIPPVIGIIRSLILLVIALLFFVTALGFGWLALTPFGISFDNRAEGAIYSIGFGLCLMTIVVLALGLAGLLSPVVFWSLILVGTAAAVFFLLKERRESPFEIKPNLSGLERFDYFFLVFIGLTLLLGLQLALTPPIGWDGLTTHLVFVKDILEAGKLQPVPVIPGRFAGHLLFIWGMALGGDTIPQLLTYGMALLLIAAVALFARRYFGLRTALLAAAIFISVEVFILNAGWPYLDVPVAFLSWLAVVCLYNWQRKQSTARSWLLLSVIFAVFASQVKLNGLFIFPVLVFGYALGLYWNKGEFRRRAIDGVLALVLAVVLTLIWSAAQSSITPGETDALSLIPPQVSGAASGLPTIDNLAAKLSEYSTVLWEMTIIGQQGAVIYDGTISPFFLLLFPILVVLRKKPKVVIFLMAAALVELASWLLFPRDYYQNRHLILAYPIFSILAAYIVFRLDEFNFEWFSLSGFFRLLLLLVFGLQLLSTLVWWQSLNPMSYLLGLQSREEYLASTLNSGSSPGYYDMMKVMEETLLEDSVVGMLWPEPRLYYCPGSCVRFPLLGAKAAEDMATVAEDGGLTHVLVSRKGLEYWLNFYEETGVTREDRIQFRKELAEFTSDYGRLVHNQDDSFYLYELILDGGES